MQPNGWKNGSGDLSIGQIEVQTRPQTHKYEAYDTIYMVAGTKSTKTTNQSLKVFWKLTHTHMHLRFYSEDGPEIN